MAGEVTEICLLLGDWQIQRWWSCMPRSDWFSWVQAIGVICTLVISIWVATWPRRQAVKSAVAQAKAFSILLYKYLRLIILTCPGKHEDALRLYVSIIRDLMETNSNLNYGCLSNKVIVHVYELRCASVAVEEYLKAFEASKKNEILNELFKTLKDLSPMLDYSLDIILKESNLVLNEKGYFDKVVSEIDKGIEFAARKGQKITADNHQNTKNE